MTFVYDSTTTASGYYIELRQDKFESVYRVTVCPVISDNIAGYPISKRIYQTKEKALRGFKQAVRYYR